MEWLIIILVAGAFYYGIYRLALSKNRNPWKNYYLDLDKTDSFDDFAHEITKELSWDNLIFCPATMQPIGPFESLDISI